MRNILLLLICISSMNCNSNSQDCPHHFEMKELGLSFDYAEDWILEGNPEQGSVLITHSANESRDEFADYFQISMRFIITETDTLGLYNIIEERFVNATREAFSTEPKNKKSEIKDYNGHKWKVMTIELDNKDNPKEQAIIQHYAYYKNPYSLMMTINMSEESSIRHGVSIECFLNSILVE